MKAVAKLAEKLKLEIAPLNIRFKNCHRLGFALYSKTPIPNHGFMLRLGGESFPEILTIEPTLNNDKKWKVTDHRQGGGIMWLKANEFDRVR